MNVIYEFTEKQIEQLHALYQDEWWSKGRSLEATKRCILGSQLCIGLVDEFNQLQGFARVVTDFTFKALIFDVIVSPEYRGIDQGKRLISLIKKDVKLKEVVHFELYCRPELQEFYKSLGFSADIGGIQLMRLNNA